MELTFQEYSALYPDLCQGCSIISLYYNDSDCIWDTCNFLNVNENAADECPC